MITSPPTATRRLSAVSIEATVNKEKVIPLVPAHTIKGVFTPEMKQEVIEKVAEAMVSIEGEKVYGVAWVTINEVESGDWGVGGQALKADYVHTLAAGLAASKAALSKHHGGPDVAAQLTAQAGASFDCSRGGKASMKEMVVSSRPFASAMMMMASR